MKILVAMSGGVDSSMVAKTLKDEGHEIIGCYMKLHDNPKYHEENIRKVKKVGEFLGIETKVLDLQKEFQSSVYNPFVEIYKNGKTPNPCALCNRTIKLGKLLEYALSLGCEKLATGHYVRVEDGLLKVARDLSKDQSYFLANTDPNSLKYMIFPLGNTLKSELKERAKKFPELEAIAGQKESSEICFVEKTYIDILQKHYDTDKPGLVKDLKGNVIGKHNGYMHYTIGKRKGFTVDVAHEPHYVLKINSKNNELIVGKKDELKQSEFELENLNKFTKLDDDFKGYVKIRYRSPMNKAKIIDHKVYLDEPAYGIASGQLAVFYDENDKVIASGFIK
ncbi:tRNA U34 2-thiouridylase [Campylobacter blaseri]|uniref:tRNA-specific 2-thiouridylase MnmA n=1 Tax=Campylobacter blaseri TaxID=2042961 RepID=A0A2P8QZ89_9BACT|nr:tRNA 2-thiouridine(34) synthase MnmA [Campylobacter blaseri]PSM51563.1 tRNA 2-thiouridine(34) synthase MnmA [Campylobacter blaseri]PSM53356.1 tRNA 2-thiouridine(34) synthase MnmA [Campylobacter blaseri]QKF86650.1 tRNA U34 2-thiouridylase [Campylobacter blaseri]